MRDKIVVIGGYGKVGRMICHQLVEYFPNKVYAAGRNKQSAQDFSEETGGRVWPLVYDVYARAQPTFFSDVNVIVMCLDLISTELVKMCLQVGIHYIDITANGDFLEELIKLNKHSLQATGLISVGLAPGLTNLLAQQAVQDQGDVLQLDISIMLGSGEKHGPAAVDWTLKQMTHAFTNQKKIDFGSYLGKRATYGFPFSDQHTLPNTLHIPNVTTRLCFDSKLLTMLAATLRMVQLSKLLNSKKVRQWMIRWLDRINRGTDTFAIKVDAYSSSAHVQRCIIGNNQTRITAQIAALTVRVIYENAMPKGVYHIEQLFELVGTSNEDIQLMYKGNGTVYR